MPCSPSALHHCKTKELRDAACRLIDGELHSRGAMLFQGLPITSPELCSEFVEAMGYQRAPYEPFGKGRDKVRKKSHSENSSVPALSLPLL